MNQVAMVGRVSNKPKLSSTSNGMPVLNFDVECQEKWIDKSGQNQVRSQYHQIVQYGKMADQNHALLHEGAWVAISGALWTSGYEENGVKKYRTQVKANTIEVMGDSADASEPISDPFE